MESVHKLLFTALIILAAAIDGAQADAMVTGTVFCDQCKDGQRSLFDYPLSGTKVRVACPSGNGQVTMWKEETTNWFGNYAMRFDGAPDLSGCYAQVSSSERGSMGCGAAAGPAQNLKLMFRMFDMEMYMVDALLSEPAQPMSFCPKSSSPTPPPVTQIRPIRPPPPPPVTQIRPPPPPPTPAFRFPPMPHLPPMPRLPPLPPMPLLPPLPPMPRLPPMPPLPPLPRFPPMPFVEASACPHENWIMPEYRCYWRVVNPHTKVALIFGPIAARRYGTDMTLWEGLQGRGDPYRTLLRESTTAFLNSYNSLQFSYNTISVVQHLNLALMGSPQHILLTALRFKRANSGIISGESKVTCKFTPCK